MCACVRVREREREREFSLFLYWLQDTKESQDNNSIHDINMSYRVYSRNALDEMQKRLKPKQLLKGKDLKGICLYIKY